MVGLILVLIGVAVFFSWHKKKKQGNTSSPNQNSEKNGIVMQSDNNMPLKNELEKQYYEIIYGLLTASPEGRSPDDMCRFIEFHTGKNPAIGFSDTISASTYFKLVRSGTANSPALFSLFDGDKELRNHLSNKNISVEGIETVIELNRNLDESPAYRYLPKDADAICEGKASKDNIILLAELLSDDTVKQYYAIVSASLKAIESDNIALAEAKRFIEFHTQQCCESQKLEYALEFVKIKGAKKQLGITSDDINKYKCSKREAYNVIYSEIIESIKTDCKEIFDIVESYGIEHFEEGLSKKTKQYENKISKELTKEIFREIIQEMYFNGNDTVKTSLFNRINQYSYDAKMREYYRLGIRSVDDATLTTAKLAAAITLRALNFEKYGQNREDYKSVTENDCCEFVSNCEIFMREIEKEVAKDPFNVNTQNLINAKANEIINTMTVVQQQGGWYLPCDSENYYADSLCNGFWKWIAEDYENGDSLDTNVVFEILLTYYKPDDSDFEILDEQRRKAEQQRREVEQHNARVEAINKQCRSCAHWGKAFVGNGGKCEEYRENCPSWTPKS